MITVAEPTLKSLYLEMRFRGKVLSSATGFIVQTAGTAALVTNRHNVTGRHQDSGECLSKTGGVPDEVVIHHHSAFRGLGAWEPTVEPLFDGEIPRWIEHPEFGPHCDFVALPLTKTLGMRLCPYDPAKPGLNIAVGVAEAVSVIGFPLGLRSGGLFPVWATGFIASEPQIDHDKRPVFLVDCRTRPGQSGSPVVAYRAGGIVASEGGQISTYTRPVFRFLGIYSGRINADSDIGTIWKASAIASLVGSIQ